MSFKFTSKCDQNAWLDAMLNPLRRMLCWLDQFNPEPEENPRTAQLSITPQSAQYVSNEHKITALLEISVEDKGINSFYKTKHMNIRNLQITYRPPRPSGGGGIGVSCSPTFYVDDTTDSAVDQDNNHQDGSNSFMCHFQQLDSSRTNDGMDTTPPESSTAIRCLTPIFHQLPSTEDAMDTTATRTAPTAATTTAAAAATATDFGTQTAPEARQLPRKTPRRRRPSSTRVMQHTFKTYVVRVSKGIHPTKSMSAQAKVDMDRMVLDLLDLIAEYAGELVKFEGKKTLTERHIEMTIRLKMTPGLAEHAMHCGRSAVENVKA